MRRFSQSLLVSCLSCVSVELISLQDEGVCPPALCLQSELEDGGSVPVVSQTSRFRTVVFVFRGPVFNTLLSQVPHNGSSLVLPGRRGDRLPAAVRVHVGGAGFRLPEDLHGSESQGSVSGRDEAEQPEQLPGRRQSAGETADLFSTRLQIFKQKR